MSVYFIAKGRKKWDKYKITTMNENSDENIEIFIVKKIFEKKFR